MGGQERRRVVEAQEEAEEAPGFDRQSEEGSIILSHDRADHSNRLLSQPAMSRVLERLREMFKDPLLVRSGRIYERTVRADRLLRELETVLPRLEAMVRGEEFDPARSEERFRLALTDHACTILLPSLVNAIREGAPRIKLEVSAWRTRAYEDVAAGRIDAALSAELSRAK